MEFELTTDHDTTRGVRVRVPSEDFDGLLRLRIGVLDTHASYVDLSRAEAEAIAGVMKAMAGAMDEE